MWSRRAQEYEAKINSGDLVTIAEVVRDLHRSDAQPEHSNSERRLYEAALDRVVREIAAAQDVDEFIAMQKVAEALTKGGRLQRKHEEKTGRGREKEICINSRFGTLPGEFCMRGG